MLYVGLDIHDKRIAMCVLGETGQIVRRGSGPHYRRDDADLRGAARPLRGLLRGQLRLRPLPRPAQPDRRPGHRGASGALAADLPIEGQERPQGRRAAGQTALPGRDAGGVRAFRRCPHMAELITCLGRVIAERTRAKHFIRSLLRCPRSGQPSGRRRAWSGPAGWNCRRRRAVATRPAVRGDRGADAPGEANRAAAQLTGRAVARRRLPAEHPRGRRHPGEAVVALIDDPHRFRDAIGVGLAELGTGAARPTEPPDHHGHRGHQSA